MITNMLEGLPKECQLHCRMVIDNLAISSGQAPLLSIAKSDMRQKLAEMLVHTKAKQIVGEYSTELRIDVLVFSPDEFAGIVRKAADSLYGYPNR